MDPLFAAIGLRDLWYALPLVIAVSAVYAATRHELLGPIIAHSFRVAGWILTFMAIIFVVIEGLSWWAAHG
jgi:hypothetical protein